MRLKLDNSVLHLFFLRKVYRLYEVCFMVNVLDIWSCYIDNMLQSVVRCISLRICDVPMTGVMFMCVSSSSYGHKQKY